MGGICGENKLDGFLFACARAYVHSCVFKSVSYINRDNSIFVECKLRFICKLPALTYVIGLDY